MKTALLVFIFLICCGSATKAQSEVEIWYWVYTYDYATSRNSKAVKHSRSIEIYNDKGQLIEIRSKFNKDLYDKTVLEYNDAGQKIKETDYWSFNPTISITRNYTYNEQGLLETMVYQSHDKREYTETKELYFYEGTDLVKKVQTISPYNSSQSWSYTYETIDGKKRVTEIHTLPGGRTKKKRVAEYNEKGLLILELGVGGYRIEYEYTYDANGNWITQKKCIREGVFGPWRCGEFRKTLPN
jgi:hypothetical protein